MSDGLHYVAGLEAAPASLPSDHAGNEPVADLLTIFQILRVRTQMTFFGHGAHVVEPGHQYQTERLQNGDVKTGVGRVVDHGRKHHTPPREIFGGVGRVADKRIGSGANDASN